MQHRRTSAKHGSEEEWKQLCICLFVANHHTAASQPINWKAHKYTHTRTHSHANALLHANSNKQLHNGQQRWRWQAVMLFSDCLLLLLLLLVIGHCRSRFIAAIAAPHRTAHFNAPALGILCLATTSLPPLINKLQYFPIFSCNGAYDCYLIIITTCWHAHNDSASCHYSDYMCRWACVSVCMRFIIACKLCESSLRKSRSEMKQ